METKQLLEHVVAMGMDVTCLIEVFFYRVISTIVLDNIVTFDNNVVIVICFK
jgi:hypothetical protein